jgi:hypothetical protein
MGIRHMVEAANVDAEGFVIDPSRARHGTVFRGALGELSGPIDPLTHLNLDFSHHRLEDCVVAGRLEPGAPVRLDAEGRLVKARTRPGAMRRLGAVDLDARRIAWLELHRERRRGAFLADR